MTYVLAFTDCQGNRHERDFASFDAAVDIAKEYFLRPDFSEVIVYKRRDAPMRFRITCATSNGRATIGSAPDRSGASFLASMAKVMGFEDARVEEDRR